MPTREQVLEALKDVQDPELHKSLVELNMIRDIVVDGSKGVFDGRVDDCPAAR